MSSVYEVRRRVLRERLVSVLRRAESVEVMPLNDETIRLAAGALTLLDQHQVDDKARCRRCRHSGRWARFGRKQRCLVYAVLSLYLEQPMDVARGQVRGSVYQGCHIGDNLILLQIITSLTALGRSHF